MKIIKTLFLAIFFISCSSQKDNNLPSSLEPKYIENATNFAKSHFENCKTQNFKSLSKEIAVPWLVRNLTVEVMKNTCTEINKKYGELIEFKIEQTLFYKDRYIYRFKVKYSNSKEYSEIRVSSNLNHKYSGLFFRPVWNDKFTEFNPN